MSLLRSTAALLSRSADNARAVARTGRPRPAAGVELVGEYKDSGFKEPPFIARRPDGQVLQLPRLLYVVAAHCDARRDARQIARAAGAELGRRLSARDVAFLIETKLRPAGLVATQVNAPTPQLERVDPLLAFRHRAVAVPARVVQALAAVLRPFFNPALIGAALSWLAVFDVWLFAHHGLDKALGEIVLRPVLVLVVLGLIVLSTAWHELGHAAACRYGGAKPGAMGAGLYLVWPAFYTDVTDAYRLDRRGRLRTDLGGIYFNGLFALALAGAYFWTGFEVLLAAAALQHLQALQQLMPFVRLDGYYVLTDLAGVPDMLSRVRPVLRSLLPGATTDPRVRELKPWVRIVTTAYVIGLVAAFGLVIAELGLHAPEHATRALDSVTLYFERARAAIGAQRLGDAALAGVQLTALLIPLAGMALLASRVLRALGRRVTPRALRRVAPRLSPRPGAVLAFAAGVALASALFVWGPSAVLRANEALTMKAGTAKPSDSAARARRAERRRERAQRAERRRRAAARRRARARERAAAARAARAAAADAARTSAESVVQTAPAPTPSAPAPSPNAAAPTPAPAAPTPAAAAPAQTPSAPASTPSTPPTAGTSTGGGT
jgi:putative peptide zinc metalloprotease protein